MTSQRLSVLIVAVVLGLAVLAGLWLSQRLTGMVNSPPPTAVPVATSTAAPTPSSTPLQVPPGFRLAGVAVNVDQTYAVIELPNGHHVLLRLHDEVEGLGRITGIGAERVVIATADGELTLWIAPASTLTPTPTRRTATTTPKPKALPNRTAADTTPVSTPSGVPGRRVF